MSRQLKSPSPCQNLRAVLRKTARQKPMPVLLVPDSAKQVPNIAANYDVFVAQLARFAAKRKRGIACFGSVCVSINGAKSARQLAKYPINRTEMQIALTSPPFFFPLLYPRAENF
jgi:hypothetical protein